MLRKLFRLDLSRSQCYAERIFGIAPDNTITSQKFVEENKTEKRNRSSTNELMNYICDKSTDRASDENHSSEMKSKLVEASRSRRSHKVEGRFEVGVNTL